MLTETVAAILLSICVGCFFSVNLYNILKFKTRSGVKVYAEVQRPSAFSVGLAAVGTGIYFLEVFLYLILVFTELILMLRGFPFYFQFPFMVYVQILGLVLTLLGFFLFIWSVISRGRYAASWEMSEDHKLVTWGPYRHMRHPSYLGYFLMFLGFFLLWTNLFTLIPLFAIPGYYRVTSDEERLLIKRFGDEYVEYQKKTGKFIPKLR